MSRRSAREAATMFPGVDPNSLADVELATRHVNLAFDAPSSRNIVGFVSKIVIGLVDLEARTRRGPELGTQEARTRADNCVMKKRLGAVMLMSRIRLVGNMPLTGYRHLCDYLMVDGRNDVLETSGALTTEYTVIADEIPTVNKRTSKLGGIRDGAAYLGSVTLDLLSLPRQIDLDLPGQIFLEVKERLDVQEFGRCDDGPPSAVA